MKQKNLIQIIGLLVIGGVIGFFISQTDIVVENQDAAAVAGKNLAGKMNVVVDPAYTNVIQTSLSKESSQVASILSSHLKTPVKTDAPTKLSAEVGSSLSSVLDPTGAGELHLWMFDCGGGWRLVITWDEFNGWYSFWTDMGSNWGSGGSFGACHEIWHAE